MIHINLEKMSTTSRVTSDRDARRTLFADLMLDTNSDKNVDVEGIANLKEVEKLTIKENEVRYPYIKLENETIRRK